MPTATCIRCGKEYHAARSTSKYCSDRCRYRAHTSKQRRVTITPDLRWRVLRRDGFRCRYCGATPVEKELTVDHVVSIADGGLPEAMDNLVTACHPCNRGKSADSLDPSEVPAGPA